MQDMHQGDPLNIVHLFRAPVGGLFRHVRDLAEAQSAEGHRVGIVCDASTGGTSEDRLLEALRPRLALGLHRIDMQRQIGLGDIVSAIRTYKVIKQLQPDVLHGHGAKGGAYSRVFGSLLRVFRSRVARIYSPHGGSLHFAEKTMQGRIVFAMERMLAPMTDALLFVCAYEKSVFERVITPVKCLNAIIPNGLRPEEFSQVATNQDAADLLFIGTMRDLKGPDLLIDAIAHLQKTQAQPVTAVLVGDGDQKERYIAQAERLGLCNQLRFLPGMAAHNAFPLGHIMVVPSRAEALPYIVLESLGAGKPVIASNVGGIPEIFAQDRAALFEPNVEALSAKISAVRADIPAYEAGMPERSALQSRFSVTAMATAVGAIYRSARS